MLKCLRRQDKKKWRKGKNDPFRFLAFYVIFYLETHRTVAIMEKHDYSDNILNDIRGVTMIQINNLGKRFGNVEVLKDISMHIEDGEIYGIIGHSGAGKSTLLRCMNGLEDYQSGSLKVMGKEVSSLDGKSMREFRRDISMIFQNFNLLNRADVYHNVALPLQFAGENINSDKNKEKILKLLDMVGLSDKVHERPSNLSGGQKQRVAIARALVMDPKVLLCDEATSALDPQTTMGILDLLLKINKELNLTIVVVTHQMEVVKQICSRVAFIKDGNIVAEGRPEQLFVMPNDDVKEFLGGMPDVLPKSGENIQIFYDCNNAAEPIITRISRELDIDMSIAWGKIENFRSTALGALVINVDASKADSVCRKLDSYGVKWERIKED